MKYFFAVDFGKRKIFFQIIKKEQEILRAVTRLNNEKENPPVRITYESLREIKNSIETGIKNPEIFEFTDENEIINGKRFSHSDEELVRAQKIDEKQLHQLIKFVKKTVQQKKGELVAY